MFKKTLTLAKTHDFCASKTPRLTVVCIHGIAADSSSYTAALQYLEGTASLKDVRFITYDLLGSGKSYTSEYRELSFTGTFDMCQGFQNVILKNADLSEKKICRNHSIYRVRWSNREEIITILGILYNNCGDHYLKRKYALYQEIKGGIPNG